MGAGCRHRAPEPRTPKPRLSRAQYKKIRGVIYGHTSCLEGRFYVELRRGDLAFSMQVQLLRRNVKLFRGWLVFRAHRLLYHSTLGLRVMKKGKKLEI